MKPNVPPQGASGDSKRETRKGDWREQKRKPKRAKKGTNHGTARPQAKLLMQRSSNQVTGAMYVRAKMRDSADNALAGVLNVRAKRAAI